MNRRQNGFTLAEALVSMAILALLLGLAASIFVGYSRLTRQSSTHERNLILGYAALDRMRSEVVSSINLSSPPNVNGATASVLEFEKIDPSVLTRLPNPDPPPATFEPFSPNYNCQVSYQLVSGKLMRKAKGFNGWNSEEVLMSGVLGLSTTFEAPAGLNITLNLQEETSTRKLIGHAYIWTQP